jgi:ADP-ribose pyrophosphatase
MHRVIGLHIDGDELIEKAGGFLSIRRLRLRNRRDDGSLSPPYVCDFHVRPMGLDAVVVAIWHRAGGVVKVLLRDGLRPPLAVGRAAVRQVVPDPREYLFLTELVAGIVEEHDRGEEGMRRRAADEVLEEAGYRIDPAAIVPLGHGLFPSPGSAAEKFFLMAAEVTDPADQHPLEGDGSPMEEGATVRWVPLAEALAMCARGEIEDCKTELGLRRLKDHLGT